MRFSVGSPAVQAVRGYKELKVLAEQFGAFLLIDEAHATGVYGPQGPGLGAEFEGSDCVIVLHTGGKALGCSGALVTAPGMLIDSLIIAPGPLFSPPPLRHSSRSRSANHWPSRVRSRGDVHD